MLSSLLSAAVGRIFFDITLFWVLKRDSMVNAEPRKFYLPAGIAVVAEAAAVQFKTTTISKRSWSETSRQ